MFFLLISILIVLLVLVKFYFFVSCKKCVNKVSLIGKTVLITGANTGIGFSSAIEFAKRGARIILACRDPDKAENAKEKIIKETQNNNIEIQILDLSSLASIRNCAKNIINSNKKLDILINNAGAGGLMNKTTLDGFQLIMQINYFGHVLFTFLLMDLLKKSPKARIINVASLLAKIGKFSAKDLNKFSGTYGTYSNSKLCNILFTIKLAEKLKDTNISVFSLHPGAIKTDVYRRMSGWKRIILDIVAYFTFKSPEEGAQTTIFTATELELEKYSGKHFEECEIVPPYTGTINENFIDEVWNETFKLLKIIPENYF